MQHGFDTAVFLLVMGAAIYGFLRQLKQRNWMNCALCVIGVLIVCGLMYADYSR